MERKKLPYGIPNFRRISEEGYVFVDKTAFVEKLEERIEQVKCAGIEQLKKYMHKVSKQVHRNLKGVLLIFSGEGICVDCKDLKFRKKV